MAKQRAHRKLGIAILLENRHVEEALSGYMVEALYENVDVRAASAESIRLADLERPVALRDAGALDGAELESEKRRLLDTSEPVGT